MLFKTLTLKIYRPTKVKRQILDNAMKNYSNALQWLLLKRKEAIIAVAVSGENLTKGKILSLLEKDCVKELNSFNVEPFKDSLKMEFASIVSGYIAQFKRKKTGFPQITINEQDYKEEFDKLISNYTFKEISFKNFQKKSTALISHAERIHLLYFGRYSCTRDFCLLYDELADKFFVKLYLLNKENKIKSPENSGYRDLKYVAPGLPEVKFSKGTRRYLILPLAFGKSQYTQLKSALYDPSILHTAKVMKKGKEYYLLLNIECKQKIHINTVTTMGVARDEIGLHYTVLGSENGRINIDYNEESRIYIIAANIIKKAVMYKAQVIIEANGGKNDAAVKGKKSAPFLSSDYIKLAKVLSYKLPETGLPAPIEVSANGLYNVCPKCGCRTSKNRLTEHIFACIECGYAGLIENIGSEGLAVRLEKYRNDKIPIYCLENEDSLVYYNKALDFEFEDTSKSRDLSQFYYQLALYVNSNVDCANDSKKYCLIKKLRDADNIRYVIRIKKKKSK